MYHQLKLPKVDCTIETLGKIHYFGLLDYVDEQWLDEYLHGKKRTRKPVARYGFE